MAPNSHPRAILILFHFCCSLSLLSLSAQKHEEVVVLPDADATISNDSPDNPVGNQLILRAESKYGKYITKTYLRFSVPPSESMVDAKMVLTTASWEGQGVSTHRFELFGINDGVQGDEGEWSEVDLTWNQAPQNMVGSNDVGPEATSLAVFEIPGDTELLGENPGATVVIESEELVKFLKSDTNGTVSFILREVSNAGENSTFVSKDSPYGDIAPQLKIITSP